MYLSSAMIAENSVPTQFFKKSSVRAQDMSYTSQTVVVTGGASGLGRATARKLAKKGFKVAIVDLNEENLEKTSAESPNIFAFKCDTSNLEMVQNVVVEIETQLGPIERLNHCAGIMPSYLLSDDTPENIMRVMSINYGGTINFVQSVLPSMLKQNRGDIVVYGSMVGSVPTSAMGAYCSSKAATNMYMEILAEELKETNLRILLVCPPPVQTPLMLQSINTNGSKSLKKAYENGQMADPETIVTAVEQALEKGMTQTWPGLSKWLHLLRRFSPGLLWSITNRLS